MVTQCLTDSCTMTPCGSTLGHGVTPSSPQGHHLTASSPQPTQIDSVTSNTGCSTTVTSSQSQNVTSPASQQGCKKSADRRTNKPIMEKKRRARINNCLNELKALILDAMQKDPARHSKLEKADILEMTVKHLETIQRQQSTMTTITDPHVLNKFRAGFSECAGEVGRFPGLEPPVRRRLLQHLTNVLNTSTGNEGTSAIQGNPVNPTGNSSNPATVASQGNPAGATSAATIPGLQVHILPAVTNEGATTPLVTQQSILFSTTGNGASLQLVPTRLPNGDIALVLPSNQPNHQSQLNINVSTGNTVSSAKVVTGSSRTTVGAVTVPCTVVPGALSPLPMLIPITRNSSQPNGTGSPTVPSSTVSTSSVPSSTPSVSQDSPITIPSIPSYVPSSSSAPETNTSKAAIVVSSDDENISVTSTVSSPPNNESSSSSPGSSLITSPRYSTAVSMNTPNVKRLDGESMVSNDCAPKNQVIDRKFLGETANSTTFSTRGCQNIGFNGGNMVGSSVPPRTLQSGGTFMQEDASHGNISPSNSENFSGENTNASGSTQRKPAVNFTGENTTSRNSTSGVTPSFSVENRITSNSTPGTTENCVNFAADTAILTNFTPSNPFSINNRLHKEEQETICRNPTLQNHPPSLKLAGERLIHLPNTSSLPSLVSPVSSFAGSVSPVLRHYPQNHRLPIADVSSSIGPGFRQSHRISNTDIAPPVSPELRQPHRVSNTGLVPLVSPELRQPHRVSKMDLVSVESPELRQPYKVPNMDEVSPMSSELRHSHSVPNTDVISLVSPGLRQPHRVSNDDEVSLVSTELRYPQQTHRLPSRDMFYHEQHDQAMNIDMGEQQLRNNNSLLQIAPAHVFQSRFNGTQGTGLGVDQNRGYVSPPMTRPLCLVKKTDDEEMEDDMPWRPW
ncbi:mucin-5AC-like [Nilaparvata lugens]|uniref:mucin-5AC-like n=1 Tax=Nilaparvata lugens TaxID=108931 RepID=UPI00193DF25F|nr:mucin-5AC-like [Nilaparvata lugens]